jgi:alpha-glucosidase
LNETEILASVNISREARLFEWQGRGVRLLSTGLDRGPGKIEGPIHLKPNEGETVKVVQ